MFSPEEYTHTPPGKALFQVSIFVVAVFGLAGVVSLFYPDKPSAPREFPDGLEAELGGPGAVRVSPAYSQPFAHRDDDDGADMFHLTRPGRRGIRCSVPQLLECIVSADTGVWVLHGLSEVGRRSSVRARGLVVDACPKILKAACWKGRSYCSWEIR